MIEQMTYVTAFLPVIVTFIYDTAPTYILIFDGGCFCTFILADPSPAHSTSNSDVDMAWQSCPACLFFWHNDPNHWLITVAKGSPVAPHCLATENHYLFLSEVAITREQDNKNRIWVSDG